MGTCHHRHSRTHSRICMSYDRTLYSLPPNTCTSHTALHQLSWPILSAVRPLASPYCLYRLPWLSKPLMLFLSGLPHKSEPHGRSYYSGDSIKDRTYGTIGKLGQPSPWRTSYHSHLWDTQLCHCSGLWFSSTQTFGIFPFAQGSVALLDQATESVSYTWAQDRVLAIVGSRCK